MADQSRRLGLIGRGVLAHFAGLAVASLWVSIQMDAFPLVPTTIEGIILGAFLASPWAIAFLAASLLAPRWLEQHPVHLCVFGPVIVWASAYLVIRAGLWFPERYMDPVLVASVVASAVYFILYRRDRRYAAGKTPH